MKVLLTAMLLCLYIQTVVPHRPMVGRSMGPRMVFPIRFPHQRVRPIPRVLPMVSPLILHKKYKEFARRQSAQLAHVLNKRRHYMQKAQVRHSRLSSTPRFIPVNPIRTRPVNIITRRTLGRRQTPRRLPFGFQNSNVMPMVPFSGRRADRRRMNIPHRINTGRAGILGVRARPFPFREDRDFDDFDDFDGFRDFDNDDSNDRMFDQDILDNLNDIDDSFDDRFNEGFGSIAGSRDIRRINNNFNRNVATSRSDFDDRFEFGLGSQGQRDRDFMPDHDSDQTFRTTFGPRIGMDGRPDFDEKDFKPNIPDFVENALDTTKDFTEKLHEELKQDDNVPNVIVTHVEANDLPILDDTTHERVPDLTDVINAASKNVIEGFEMLSSRQRNDGSDIMNIFRDNPFDMSSDSFLSEMSDSDIISKLDDDSAGTFALLGIDPGSVAGAGIAAMEPVPPVQPLSADKAISGNWPTDFGFSPDKTTLKGNGIVGGESKEQSLDSQNIGINSGRIPSINWPLDLGFSNDNNMNIVLDNDVPRPSTL